MNKGKTMENIQHLISTLQNHTNKLAIIFQWVKTDHINFQQFTQLLDWCAKYEQQQRDLDIFD